MSEHAKLSIKELRKIGQGNAPESGRDPFLGLTIRFFSIYITKLALRTSITPNQMTVLSVLVFFSGISFFLFSEIKMQLIGVLLIYLSIVLDGCDGELARIRGNKSGVGSLYTEPVSHDVQYGVMFLPLSLGAYFAGAPVWVMIAGFVAAVSKLMFRLFLVRFDKVLRKQQVDSGEVEWKNVEVPMSEISFTHRMYRHINRNFFSSVGFIIPLTIFILLERVDLFVYLFAAFYAAVAALKLLQQIRFVSKLGK